MPKKDTTASVLSMLSTQGEQLRPPATREVETEEPDAEVREIAPKAVGDVSSERPTRARSRQAGRETVGSKQDAPATPEPVVEDAPRTHRLDQKTANALRSAWLAARLRGEVTISQQEYAGRIIALGLAAEAQQLGE